MQTNQTETYLFQMTIPSVQKFINASRKSSDLWASSLIVSYIIKKLLNKIINKYKNECVGNKIQLIYPFTEDYFNEKDIISNIPNIAIFTIDCITESEALELKKKTEQFFKNLVDDLVEFGIKKFLDEEIEDEDIRIAFNVKNIKNIKNKIEGIKKRKNKYIDLAKYQIKDTLKLFIEYIPLDKNYEEVSEDLADILNYKKKSHLPDRSYIENFHLIESPDWEKWSEWDDFYKNDLKQEIINKKNKKEEIENLEYIQGVYRCSSCGEHTIIGADLKDWRGNNIWKPLWETNPKYFNRGERLCGVCLAKRYFREYMRDKEGIEDESLGFPSTSEIAATSFKEEVLEIAKNNLELVQLLENFRKAFFYIPNFLFEKIKGNPVKAVRDKTKDIFPTCFEKCCYCSLAIDGEWFIEDTWKNENDYKVIGADDKKANQMLNLLGQIYNFLKSNSAEKHFKPSEYYAVILLDGDSIGEKLDKIKNSENPIKAHQKFSKTLSELSKEFKNIIEKYFGALIYSGGDDVLALVPVENALNCANEIQNKFRSTLSDKFPNIHNKSPFTMSGAIIYAHHKLPLSYILDEARKCEEKAKEGGKNRVCLKYLKRSLASAEVVVRWRDINKIKKLPTNKQFIYQLRELKYIFEFKQIYNNIKELKPFYRKSLSNRDIAKKIRGLQENLIISLLNNKTLNMSSKDFISLIKKIDLYKVILIKNDASDYKKIKIYDFNKLENLFLVKEEMKIREEENE